MAVQPVRFFVTGWNQLRVSGTASMTIGQLARLGSQAVYFVIAARVLGPAQFGTFATAAAVAGVVAPFAMWGAGDMLLQNVSRSRQRFAGEWGAAIDTIGKFGMAALLLAACGAALLLPAIPLLLVVVVAAAEFWFAALVAVAANAFQAVEDFRRTTGAWLVLSVSRLAGAAMLALLVAKPTALHWGIAYMASSAVAALLVTRAVSRRLGSPRRGLVRANRTRGLEFAVSLSSTSFSAEIGKMSLSRLDRLEVTGAYAAADRIIGVVAVPVLALLASSYPRLHRAGELGMAAALRECIPLLAMALMYAAAAALAVYFSAPLIERVLGGDYHQAIAACQVLCGLLVLRTLTLFGANCLTATNRQRRRSILQVAGACLSAVLTLLLVRQYSWQGAAAAALLAEATLACLLWTAVVVAAGRDRRAGEAMSSMQPAGALGPLHGRSGGAE